MTRFDLDRSPLDHATRWRRHSTGRTLGLWVVRLLALAALIGSLRWIARATTWAFVGTAPQQLADLIDRMLPPDPTAIPALLPALAETLHVATLGTVLAVVIAFPLALCAARRTTPHPIVRHVALALTVLSRSINALIWALILVSIFGPGPLAGVFAIALRSIGFVAKLVGEAVDEIDPRPVEAVTASGAPSPLIFVYGTLPQILPAFAGVSIFRWEINLREATILGLVGAGGIGLPLQAAIDELLWPRAAMALLLVLSLVVIGEWLSAKVRASFT